MLLFLFPTFHFIQYPHNLAIHSLRLPCHPPLSLTFIMLCTSSFPFPQPARESGVRRINGIYRAISKLYIVCEDFRIMHIHPLERVLWVYCYSYERDNLQVQTFRLLCEPMLNRSVVRQRRQANRTSRAVEYSIPRESSLVSPVHRSLYGAFTVRCRPSKLTIRLGR